MKQLSTNGSLCDIHQDRHHLLRQPSLVRLAGLSQAKWSIRENLRRLLREMELLGSCCLWRRRVPMLFLSHLLPYQRKKGCHLNPSLQCQELCRLIIHLKRETLGMGSLVLSKPLRLQIRLQLRRANRQQPLLHVC